MGPESQKVGLLAGVEPSGLWREADLDVKMLKTVHCRTLGSSDVENMRAVVARSTSRSQNGKNTVGSEHSRAFR